MNYIAQVNQFWQTRRSKRITNLQADLYFFLLNESSTRGIGNNWENPFQCPNGLVCSAIGISEKSLIDARNVLQQIGLISFENGVTKQKAPTYYLHDYCNKVSNQGSNQGGNQVSNNAVIKGTLLDKQNKRKPNSKSHLPPNGDKPEKIVTEHWKEIVDCWFAFYKQKFETEPTFNGQSTKALKSITETIQRAWLKSGKDWTKENAIICLENFFTKAYKDDWLKQNFLLPVLASKFDSIIQKKTEDGKTNWGSTSKDGNDRFQP